MNETRKISISISNLLSSPWAIKQSYLNTIITDIFRNKNIENSGELIIDYKEDIVYEIINNKAVINVKGMFYNKLMIHPCWGYVICNLENTILAAIDNYSVEEVILKIESPGGITYGVSEIHNLIKKLKTIKPINAYVNGLACSALYWIPSACSKIYAYEQSCIGSIGVYMLHADFSSFMKDMGVSIEFIQAGKYKTIGNMYEPLSTEGRKYLQKDVDETYNDFTASVASARSLNLEEIEIWADGKDFETKEALKLGLIDEIKSWQEVLGNNISGDSIATSLQKARSRIMAIGEKKISELTVEDLKEKNPELYEAIYNEGSLAGESVSNKENNVKFTALKEENKILKEKVEKFEKQEAILAEQKQIREFAASLNLVEEGERLITEDKTVVEAFSELANIAKEAKSGAQEKFVNSAPKIAGEGNDGIADDMPKNSSEAVKFVQNRDNCSKREAWKIARVEFESLFSAIPNKEEN